MTDVQYIPARESATGRFAPTANTAAEADLSCAGNWHERPITDLRPRNVADNPLLAAFHRHQAEYGDNPAMWRRAIVELNQDSEIPATDPEVFDAVSEVIGIPRDHGDIEHWAARTQAWRDHALDILRDTSTDSGEICGSCGDFCLGCELS